MMRTPSGNLAAPALQALLTRGALVGQWFLDSAKSTVKLKSRNMWGMVPVKGVFSEVTGHGTVSPDGRVSGVLNVSAASIDTRNSRRDRHLRSADFFDSNEYPDIIFTLGRIRPSGQGVAVAGTLIVRGRIRPLAFDATVSVQGESEIWITAEADVNRADFGLTWNRAGMASMATTLTAHAVFVKR